MRKTPPPLSPASKSKIKSSDRNLTILVSFLIILPLTLMFWRGLWQFLDVFLKPYGDPWSCLGVGILLPLILHLTQEIMKEWINPKLKPPIVFYILSRVVLIIHASASVIQWRGIWATVDYLRDLWNLDGVSLSTTTMLVGVVGLQMCQSVNCLVTPPLVVFVDEATPQAVHHCQLRFKSEKWGWRFIMDCVFSSVVIPLFIVLCWRGLWTLLDIFLYPEDETDSAVVSLASGAILCFFLAIIQTTIYTSIRDFKQQDRAGIAQFISIFGFIGCVLIWRGLWNAQNVLEIPEWASILSGIAGATLSCSLASVTVRGVFLDGEIDEDGENWLSFHPSSLYLRGWNSVPVKSNRVYDINC